MQILVVFSISSTVAHIFQIESMPSENKLFCSEKNWLYISQLYWLLKNLSRQTQKAHRGFSLEYNSAVVGMTHRPWPTQEDASSNNDRNHNKDYTGC